MSGTIAVPSSALPTMTRGGSGIVTGVISTLAEDHSAARPVRRIGRVILRLVPVLGGDSLVQDLAVEGVTGVRLDWCTLRAIRWVGSASR